MTSIYSFTDQQKPFDIYDLNSFMYELMDTPSILKNKYTIYIPTKGRAGLSKTVSTLDSDNIEYVLVVEPQDYTSYVQAYPTKKILQLDANNMGLWYARNYIKTYSKSKGELKHWQMDDDLEKFFIRKQHHTKNTPVNALTCISIVEKCMDKFANVAISGMDGPTYAFSKKYGVVLNRDVGGCVLVDNTIDASWDYHAAEDVHYTLSILERGYCTLRFFHVTVESTPSMKTSGGCTTDYSSSDKLKQSYDRFIEKWPGKVALKQYPPDNPKKWGLTRKFYNHYKQQLELTDE